MGVVFCDGAPYTARQRYAYRQVGAHRHVSWHVWQIWYEYLHQHRVKCDIGGGYRYDINPLKLFLLAWLAPVAMSGLIEILQATCTGGRRSGEWLDFAANSIGVTLAAIGGIVVLRFSLFRNSQAKP